MSALNSNLWPLLGQVVLHSLWQGALVALLAALFLRVLRERDPRERYAVGGMALLLVAAMPVVTFLWLQANTHVHVAAAAAPAPVHAAAAAPAEAPAPGALTWVALAWVLGALVQQLRLVVGYGRLSGLKRRGAEVAPARYQSLVEELAEAMGIARRVRLAVSGRVNVPSLVGWLEPVVLVPVGALSQLSTAEVRAVLAHELAHLKRLDPLLNGLQSVLETVFFYHPAVWWLSSRVREEREYCCDDLAAAVCGDGVTLARALANLETSRALPGSLVLSSQGGSLMQRVRRLVTPGTRRGGRASMLVPALFLASSLALTAGSASAWSASHDDECAACKARLERRAARKAAKQTKPSEQDVWVYYSESGDQPVVVHSGRWTAKAPATDAVLQWTQKAPTAANDYVLEWSQKAPAPAQDNVIQWTQKAPAPAQDNVIQWTQKAPAPAQDNVIQWTQKAPQAVDVPLNDPGEIRWDVRPTFVEYVDAEQVEFDDETGAIEFTDAAPTRSYGRYVLEGEDGKGEFLFVNSFEGQVVDFTEACQDEPGATDFVPEVSEDRRSIYWNRVVDLAEPVVVEGRESAEGVDYFFQSSTPVVIDRIAVPDAETWVQLVEPTDFTVEVPNVDVQFESFFLNAATALADPDCVDVTVTPKIIVEFADVSPEAEGVRGSFFVKHLAEDEPGNEAGRARVFTGPGGTRYRTEFVDRTPKAPEVSEERVWWTGKGTFVEARDTAIESPAGCEAPGERIEVEPQIWLDTRVQKRAPQPADEDADLRRQIRELREQLDRLERELDDKDDGVSATLWQGTEVKVLPTEVDLSLEVAPTTARYWRAGN